MILSNLFGFLAIAFVIVFVIVGVFFDVNNSVDEKKMESLVSSLTQNIDLMCLEPKFKATIRSDYDASEKDYYVYIRNQTASICIRSDKLDYTYCERPKCNIQGREKVINSTMYDEIDGLDFYCEFNKITGVRVNVSCSDSLHRPLGDGIIVHSGCFLDGVEIEEGKTHVFYKEKFMADCSEEANMEERRCVGGEILGDSSFKYSVCYQT